MIMMWLHQGDCKDILPTLEENSIDTIITDPPYGLEFMGKKWDYDVPSVEIWKECLRVLKPGGTLLTFAGSRTQHRMAVNVEDAGFILKDCIMWLYGSGFPKATDISKQLDKGHKRGVIGVGDVKRASKSQPMGQGKSGGNDTREITAPATPEAKLWNGWKSHGLKPAYEPILVAMKPNDGTYAENALKWGVSGLNIDGGRIGTDVEKTDKTNTQGRFPANIILDEEAGAMLDEQSGESKANSRFFYCAKASKAERNAGCEELGGNKHCTVKPLSLMEYLCTLTKTPKGGIVLDPFMGSGTTGLAARNTGRDFIGIELDPEYVEIAKARTNSEYQPNLVEILSN